MDYNLPSVQNINHGVRYYFESGRERLAPSPAGQEEEGEEEEEEEEEKKE